MTEPSLRADLSQKAFGHIRRPERFRKTRPSSPFEAVGGDITDLVNPARSSGAGRTAEPTASAYGALTTASPTLAVAPV